MIRAVLLVLWLLAVAVAVAEGWTAAWAVAAFGLGWHLRAWRWHVGYKLSRDGEVVEHREWGST